MTFKTILNGCIMQHYAQCIYCWSCDTNCTSLGSWYNINAEHIFMWIGVHLSMMLTYLIVWQVLDIVSILAHLYFKEKIPVKLSYVQASVLMCIGLQNQNISHIEVCLFTNVLFFCWNLSAMNMYYLIFTLKFNRRSPNCHVILL